MLAAAPYNSRKYGTLYAMEDACQTSAGEIILRITWNHCVNIGNDYLVSGWICLWFWCVFSKVNGFIRLEIFADDRLQSFGSFVIWFDGCTGLWWVHGNWCETAEHIFQLKWLPFIRNNILCAGCWFNEMLSSPDLFDCFPVLWHESKANRVLRQAQQDWDLRVPIHENQDRKIQPKYLIASKCHFLRNINKFVFCRFWRELSILKLIVNEPVDHSSCLSWYLTTPLFHPMAEAVSTTGNSMNVELSCEIPFLISNAMAIASGGHLRAAFLFEWKQNVLVFLFKFNKTMNCHVELTSVLWVHRTRALYTECMPCSMLSHTVGRVVLNNTVTLKYSLPECPIR